MNCAVHSQTEAVAYCRTCGKALCADCKRDVMGAIYCEPCIAARLQGQAVPGVPTGPATARIHGAPNPVIAALLGFVPGVGAMYNGQFARAFAHVLIFVMLVVASSNISGIFGLLIAFFEFYMAFEAYKTAEARRLGLPAPDPLGLDKLFGLQESQAHHSPGHTPAGRAAYPPTQPPLEVEPPTPPPQDNAPVGAIVLIGLGILFLLSNFGMFHIDRLWPLFLVGMGLWTAYKRTSRGCQCARCRTKGMMGPAVLTTLGVLFLLQSYYVVSFEHSFPVLLLVIGCVLLISRTGSTEGHIERGWGAPPPAPPSWSTGVVPPPPPEQNNSQVKP
jgi:hypothetical protein